MRLAHQWAIFSTVDPDLGDQFAYQLVSGAGDTDNGKFSIVGNQLRVNSAIDYETQNTFSVRVRSTDLGGLAIDEVFSLSALDVNESVVLTVTNSIVTGDVLTLLNNTGTWVDPENVNAAVTLSASLGTVVKNANGTWSWSFTPAQRYVNQLVTITANDGVNVSHTTFTMSANVVISNIKTYYKDQVSNRPAVSMGQLTAAKWCLSQVRRRSSHPLPIFRVTRVGSTAW